MCPAFATGTGCCAYSFAVLCRPAQFDFSQLSVKCGTAAMPNPCHRHKSPMTDEPKETVLFGGQDR